MNPFDCEADRRYIWELVSPIKRANRDSSMKQGHNLHNYDRVSPQNRHHTHTRRDLPSTTHLTAVVVPPCIRLLYIDHLGLRLRLVVALIIRWFCGRQSQFRIAKLER
jgi:hypothetical protein